MKNCSFTLTATVLAIFLNLLVFGQTTVCFDFTTGYSNGTTFSNQSIDANIRFTTYQNSGSANTRIWSNQLRCYQNATKGGGLIIDALNGVTITDVVITASGTTGPAEYIVDGGGATGLGATTSYNMNGLSAVTDVEFYQRDGSSGNRIYINTLCVTYMTVPSCTPATISSVTPASGPEGTVVTINASSGNLSGASVDFNGTAATVTSSSASQLTCVVPSGATTGDITITDTQPCDATYSSFTVIDNDATSCDNTTPTFSDLFISEVYDAGSGDVYYYEIYNGTGASVNLANYRIHQNNNGTFDQYYPLSGTLADGDVYVVGRNSSTCSGVVDQVVTGSGINSDDGIWLETSAGVQIDKWGTPGTAFTPGVGYYYRRKASPVNTPPSLTWNETGDWDQSGTETCSDLGTHNPGGSPSAPPTVTTNPSTSTLCAGSDAVLTVSGTEGFVGGNGLAYQWYYSAPGDAGWTVVSNGGDYSGATTATLTVSPAEGYDNYQYYCQIRENDATCYSASDAVQLDVYGSGGTAGLWTGNTDTDWCDCFNWDDGYVPTAATDVTINQTASNNCIVGTGCGSAVANSVTISSSNATNRSLTIGTSGSLTLSNGLTINKTGGSGTLLVEVSGSGSLEVGGNVSIDGSSGQNAVLRNNSASANLNIDGDLTINNNGSLDLNANGIMYLAGDFTNNYNNAAAFDHASSTILLDGTTDQSISSNMASESFNTLVLFKSGGTLILQDNIQLDASGTLVLTDDQLQLNGHELTLNNTSIGAINRTSGSIVDESGAGAGVNSGKINWVINAVGGDHIFPFADGLGGTYIPFTFNVTSGNAGTISVSTYGTPANNAPWPSSPINVTNLASTTGLSPDNRDATADRFWQVDPSGSPTATMTFGYDITELPVAPYNDHTQMIAQRYDTSTDEWDENIVLGQTTGTITGGYYVTIPNVSSFSPWTLANITSPLPAELTVFEAKKNQQQVDLTWITESEINVSHFVIERSKNGIDFHDLLSEEAAGNSITTLQYETVDYQPLNGKSYYRLRTVDFDGSFKYSPTRVVEFSEENISVLNDINDWHVLYKTTSKDYRVQIFNNIGQVVKDMQIESGTENRSFIPHNDLPQGTYLMVIEDNGVHHTVKVIK